MWSQYSSASPRSLLFPLRHRHIIRDGQHCNLNYSPNGSRHLCVQKWQEINPQPSHGAIPLRPSMSNIGKFKQRCMWPRDGGSRRATHRATRDSDPPVMSFGLLRTRSSLYRAYAATGIHSSTLLRRLASTSSSPLSFPAGPNPTPWQIFHLPPSASQQDIKTRCARPSLAGQSELRG